MSYDIVSSQIVNELDESHGVPIEPGILIVEGISQSLAKSISLSVSDVIAVSSNEAIIVGNTGNISDNIDGDDHGVLAAKITNTSEIVTDLVQVNQVTENSQESAKVIELRALSE